MRSNLAIRSLCITAAVILTAFPVQEARAQFGGGIFICPTCASEGTQLLEKLQLIAMVGKQAQAVSNQIQMINMMIAEGKGLSQHSWSNFSNDMLSLSGIINQASGAAYSLSQMDKQFTAMYPGFQPTGGVPFATQYGNWYSGTMGTLLQTLQRFGMSTNQLAAKQLVMQQLQAANATAVGRDQAIEVGNDIALETTKSIDRLSLLSGSQMQAYATYTGYQLQKDAAQVATAQNALAHTERTADGTRY